MKKLRKVVHAAPGAGTKQQSASAGGGVEPFDFGSNMFATRGGPEETPKEAAKGAFDGIFDPFGWGETEEEKKKRLKDEKNKADEKIYRPMELDHDKCIVNGAREYRYMGDSDKSGQAEIITSSHQNGTTLDHFSASRKFLADRDGYGTDRTAWKNALNNDANTGGSYGLMGDANYETEGSKIAVLVGNTNYKHHKKLPGATQDAGAMGGYYEGLGFTALNFNDASAAEMIGFFGAGAGIARPGDHLVLYFAGHGNGEGAMGVDAAADNKSGVMPWSFMVSIANRAVSAGFKATIVMDACQSDSLQLEAKDHHREVNDKLVLSEPMKMNVQSESGADDWARMEAQLKKMNISAGDMTADDYQYMMEKRHSLRRQDNGKPNVALKS